MQHKFKTKRLLFILLEILILVPVLVVTTQDYQVFPGVLITRAPLPPDIIESILTTTDGETLSMREVKALGTKRKQAVLLFHGNAQTAATLEKIRRWFAEMGFSSYSAGYRGFVHSTGFPSEQGIYLDAEAATKKVLQLEAISSEDLIVFGNSIGTGPASYIAQKYQARVLILIAPYTSIGDVVRTRSLIKYLARFLWYEFPNKKYISTLTNTCVVAAHGKLDSIIPFSHSSELKSAYKGGSTFTLLASDTATHGNIFGAVHQQIGEALFSCLE